MDDVYKLYHYEIKKGISASLDDFVASYNLNKQTADHLRFHDAYFKSRHRVGVGSRYKRSTKAMSDSTAAHKEMMDELHQRIFWKHDTGTLGMTQKTVYFTDDHPLVRAIKADLKTGNDTHIMLQDLFGALTKNKIGYGHSNGYYSSRASLLRHETFANLTNLYVNENPAVWRWLSETLPELTGYYENLIDDILANGYFGIVQETGKIAAYPTI
jgi:hypothetical protein